MADRPRDDFHPRPVATRASDYRHVSRERLVGERERGAERVVPFRLYHVVGMNLPHLILTNDHGHGQLLFANVSARKCTARWHVFLHFFSTDATSTLAVFDNDSWYRKSCVKFTIFYVC